MPRPFPVTEHPQTSGGVMGIMIDVGGITDQKITSRFGLPSLLPVSLAHGLIRHFGTGKEAISSLEVFPFFVLRGQ